MTTFYDKNGTILHLGDHILPEDEIELIIISFCYLDELKEEVVIGQLVDNPAGFNTVTQKLLSQHWTKVERDEISNAETLEILLGETKEEWTKVETLEYREIIETAVQSLDDETALQVPNLFPSWQSNETYTVGQKINYNGILYTVLQTHTSQEDLTPKNNMALYSALSN